MQAVEIIVEKFYVKCLKAVSDKGEYIWCKKLARLAIIMYYADLFLLAYHSFIICRRNRRNSWFSPLSKGILWVYGEGLIYVNLIFHCPDIILLQKCPLSVFCSFYRCFYRIFLPWFHNFYFVMMIFLHWLIHIWLFVVNIIGSYGLHNSNSQFHVESKGKNNPTGCKFSA